MSEREVLVDKMRLTYEGIFSILEVYKIMDEWFEEKGYDKREVKNIESIFPEGKYVEIVVEPWKKLTDYAKSVLKVRMIFSDIKEVEVEKDGVKVRLNQGKAHFVFDAYLETDYEHKWEAKPTFFFIRTIFDKYFYKSYTSQMKGEVMDSINDLHARIKSFLNLYRY
jgi:hypothetical protein